MKIRRVPVLAVGSVAAAVAVVVAGAGTAAADTGSAGAWTSTEVGPAAAGSGRWAVTEVAERSASAGGGTGRDVSSRPVVPVTSVQRPRSVSRARRPWRPAVVCRVGHDGGVWTVRQGDTLSWISRCTGVGLSRLIEAGDITDPDMLRIGQRIEIPAPPTAPAARTATPSAVPSRSTTQAAPTPSRSTTQAAPTPSRSTTPVATPTASSAAPVATPSRSVAPVVAVVTVTVTVAPAGVRR